MYNYLYIDDTFDRIEQGTINGIQQGDQIKVKYIPPGLWEDKISELIRILPNFHGLIVDLRLNDNPYEGQKRAQYRGSTLAQEIRTLVKEKKIINDIPIFLISADEKLEESLDKTSYDLFDSVISKNNLGDPKSGMSYADLIVMLTSFADGYERIQKERDFNQFLSLEDSSILDTRFTEELINLKEHPNHVLVRFLNKQFLTKTTALVSEEILAARLGVDIADGNWENFKNKYLNKFQYKGVLSSYFKRWWWAGIDLWWSSCISDNLSIRTLSAKQRVDFINEKYKEFKLTPQIKSEKSQSDKFWTICKSRKVPIDTIDGFLISGQDNIYPWQEKDYVSVDEALRPSNVDLWRDVATTEKNKLQRLKDFYEETTKRIRR